MAGICKCTIMEELSTPEGINVLVGDGRSDFCLARKADLTFAKSALLDFCRVEKIPHIEQREFGDVVKWLKNQTPQRGSVASQKTFIRHGLKGARNG